MALSDTAIRKAKPQQKQFKMSDAQGLYLLVKPNGSKLWRLDYQLNGKRKTLSLGIYPAVGLADARKKRDTARDDLNLKVDPADKVKAEKASAVAHAANTFGVIVDAFIKKEESRGLGENTMKRKRWLLKNVAKPLHAKPMRSILPKDIMAILQRLELENRLETARKLRSDISALFRYAIANGKADSDPAAALKSEIAVPIVTSNPAITDEKKFGVLAAAIDVYDGWPTIRACMQFLALVGCRPTEVRKAEWPEFDLKNRVWKIPVGRIKTRREHEVPLSRQAVAILEDIGHLTSKSKYVFASIRSGQKPLSNAAMNTALKRMGYAHEEHVPHGFRSSFSTIMNERKYDPEVIEHALAHKDSSVRGIYNRAKYWEARVELMQAWADIVDDLKKPNRSDFDDLF